MNLVKELNEMKEIEELKVITVDNLEEECEELRRLGLYERALKMIRNLPEEVIEENPKFMNLKIALLWKLGLFDEWIAFQDKIFSVYCEKKLEPGDPLLADWFKLKIYLVKAIYGWDFQSEAMTDLQNQISSLLGEKHPLIAFSYYFLGYLGFYKISFNRMTFKMEVDTAERIQEQNLLKARELYFEIHGTHENLDNANVCIYLTSFYDEVKEYENSMRGNLARTIKSFVLNPQEAFYHSRLIV